MSPSSPSVLSLYSPGTRSLRQSVIARAEPAAQSAGFAATLERGTRAAERDSGPRTTDTKLEDAERRDADETDEAGADATAEAPEPTDDAPVTAETITGQVETEPNAATAIDAVPVFDATQVARELASTSIAEQAKTGPVTAQILTGLALQGEAIGRFALVSPRFKPGAVAPPGSKPESSQPVPPTADAGSASREPAPASPGSAVTAAPAAPAPAPDRPATTAAAQPAASPVDPSARPSPSKVEPQADTSPRAAVRAADAPTPSSGGQTRQDGSTRQDQPGRHSDAALRGLDALLGRPAAKARAVQPLADPAANRALAAQLERGVSAALSSRDGVVTLRLSPEQLGPLKVRVGIDKGAVTAAFEAVSPKAKQAVEQSISTLKEALTAKGLTVERIEVTLAQPLPQRELGLASTSPADPPSTGPGQTSVGDQSSPEQGRHGSTGDRPSQDRAPDDPGFIALDLAPIEQAGFRYITTPDGRLGVVALA